MEGNRAQTSPHIALLSGPGAGHLIPLVALAEQLVRLHNFSVTIITAPQPQKPTIPALPKEVSLVSLPPLPSQSIPNGLPILKRILLTIEHNLSPLRNLLQSLASTTPLIALVFDIFSATVLHIAREVGVKPYIFISNSCMAFSFAFHLPELDAATQGQEYRDLSEPVQLPGCVPVRGQDLPDPLHERETEAYAVFLRLIKRYREASGVLVNSFEELEPGVVRALKDDPSVPPVYPVGPLVLAGPPSVGSECLQWLDRQPAGSVVYVSFGSLGTLTCEQMKELAWGLEMSEQRFLWVVRNPHESKASADGSPEFLPEGFTERTKGLGLVVPSWAPQMEVLGHGSTGGFVSHCGWNSTLESIMNGVPVIAWPLFAEQKLNAVLLVEGLEVALRAETDESGIVRREEIARLVRCLIEGEEGRKMRSRMEVLSDSASRAVREDGSSFRSFMEVASEWKGLGGKRVLDGNIDF